MPDKQHTAKHEAHGNYHVSGSVPTASTKKHDLHIGLSQCLPCPTNDLINLQVLNDHIKGWEEEIEARDAQNEEVSSQYKKGSRQAKCKGQERGGREGEGMRNAEDFFPYWRHGGGPQ